MIGANGEIEGGDDRAGGICIITPLYDRAGGICIGPGAYV